MKPRLPPLFLPLLLLACAGPSTTAVEPVIGQVTPPDLESVSREDFLARLAERLASPQREETPELMNSLEQLMPAWQSEQRANRERPLENVVSIKVVVHAEQVLEAFESGDRNRRLVAAWALGFARVPENDRGLVSPHPEALAALVAALGERDDELLRNVLLALWKLGDPETPVGPLLDLLVEHHDPEVRSSAALALQTVLTTSTAPLATDNVEIALSDADAKVRLHATSVARRFPQPATTARIERNVTSESSPLVRANMALALGTARARSAAPLLVGMLSSPQQVEATSARHALTLLYGQDRGADPKAWGELLP